MHLHGALSDQGLQNAGSLFVFASHVKLIENEEAPVLQMRVEVVNQLVF